jgi:hypothetical protein
MRWLLAGALAGCGFTPHGIAGDAPVEMPGEAGGSAVTADSPPPPPAACLGDASYKPLAGSAHTYKQTPTSDFDTAFDACSTAGAHLVAIHDIAENAAVQIANGDGWIGLDDLQTEGGFHWADASLLDYTNWNLGTGEPNDSNANEDCAYVHQNDGTWNDTACSDNRKGLCECEPGYVAPVRPMCRTMSGATLENGRRYFVRATAASWDAARLDCASIGAYLIAVSDNTENQLVEHSDKLNLTADAWIGLSQDVQLPTQWDWLDGAPYTYSNWITGGAHVGPGQGCVVVHHSDDKWENLACDSNHPYVCECDPGEP